MKSDFAVAVPEGERRIPEGTVTAAAACLERDMQIQVGRFVCTLSIGDSGEVEATWLPWQPKYLSREERAQYRAGRTAFLERVPPGSVVDVADRLSRSESDEERAAIPLVLPPLQATALAQFVKQMDFETIARFAPITAVCDDGKSEADLIWLALIALRGALGEARAVTKSSAEAEGRERQRHPFQGAFKGLVQVMPGTNSTNPAAPDWEES
jgi:hypothetical protein